MMTNAEEQALEAERLWKIWNALDWKEEDDMLRSTLPYASLRPAMWMRQRKRTKYLAQQRQGRTTLNRRTAVAPPSQINANNSNPTTEKIVIPGDSEPVCFSQSIFFACTFLLLNLDLPIRFTSLWCWP
jgi:hypothetical protein